MPVWFAVPGEIKRFIIVFGTNSRRTSNAHPIIRRLKPDIHSSAPSHTGSPERRDQKRRQPYQDSATFRGSSRRWRLTSLLLPLSRTDDITQTHTERHRSFRARFISFYSSNTVSPGPRPRALARQGASKGYSEGLVKAGACDGQMGHEQVDEAASHRSGVSQAVNSTTQIQAGSFDGVN